MGSYIDWFWLWILNDSAIYKRHFSYITTNFRRVMYLIYITHLGWCIPYTSPSFECCWHTNITYEGDVCWGYNPRKKCVISSKHHPARGCLHRYSTVPEWCISGMTECRQHEVIPDIHHEGTVLYLCKHPSAGWCLHDNTLFYWSNYALFLEFVLNKM